ncbi:hypothetical protein [Pseudonocardia charpentierae]|uniref:Uncharacterized protein n=1 Tax=Pseudonocardia charpentierae TaxID=3075545 RepID=A0ABU2NJ93_9PSEU|nr:hypothetical protein [Pseudonocardia sp. DSM 45834]MDT0354050.1 hypothetical protein [Pseudonocardia sp. DSM 45834]
MAELNALAAVLAVVRFKKTLGFYADTEDERHSVYRIDVGEIYNRYGDGDTEHEPCAEGAL